MLVKGSNGSGKSTLIKTLCGYVEPTEGEVTWSSSGKAIPVETVYQKYSVSSPMAELWGDLRAIDFLHVVKDLKPMLYSPQEVLEQLMLFNNAVKPIKFYSSGMKQRLMTGLAILMQSEVVFLDEPAVNLDTNGLDWFHQLLNNHLGSRTLIFSSNNPDEYRPLEFNWTVEVDELRSD